MKHAVLALYNVGFALAGKTTICPEYDPGMYTGLFLHDQNIKFLSWQHKISSVASEANGTVDSMNVDDSTSASQTVDVGRSTSVQQKSGII